MGILDHKIFADHKFPSQDFDVEQMDPYINQAEIKFLLPVLTQPLYDDIIQSPEVYSLLIDNFISPCVKNYSASLAINKLSFEQPSELVDSKMREDLRIDYATSGQFYLDQLAKVLQSGIYHFYLPPVDSKQMISGFLIKPAIVPSWQLKPYAKAIITIETNETLYECDWADAADWPEYIPEEWNWDFSAFLKSLGSFFIDWGDGSKVEEYFYFWSVCSHTYKETGVYTITISGIYAFFLSEFITAPSLMFKLKRLNMRGTSITENPNLTGLVFLADLNLANTDITAPPTLTSLSALKYLILNNTAITVPPVLTDCPYLSKLELNCPSLTVAPTLTGLYYLTRFTCNGAAINQAGLDAILTTLTSANFSLLKLVNIRVTGSVVPTTNVKNEFIAAHPGCTLYTN